MSKMLVSWVRRLAPLPPVAVAARDEAAQALVRRLLSDTDERLGQLSVVVGDGLLVARAETDSLPWVDGARYLGIDPAAPGLLLPTTRTPDVPVQLFERRLSSAHEGLASPVAVLFDDGDGLTLVSLSDGRAPSRAGLERWLDAVR